MKRQDYIDWDQYFMGVAILSSQRSKDPHTQVGACIVNPQKRIVGIGYNGFPNSCDDDKLPWGRDGDMLNTKYAYVVHAELNAILNSKSSLDGCTIYVDLFPCSECVKAIIQSGIKKICYLCDKYNNTDNNTVSKKLLKMANIEYKQLIFDNKEIVLHFDNI